jgi:hypothetical protein
VNVWSRCDEIEDLVLSSETNGVMEPFLRGEGKAMGEED